MEDETTTDEAGPPYPLGSLRDIITTLFKHKGKIVLGFLLVFLPITAWVNSSVPSFEADASIVLKFGREHIVRPEVGTVNEYVDFDQEAAIETELNIISSRDLARQVVQTIGVRNIYPKLASSPQKDTQQIANAATSRFSRNLNSESVNYSNVIKLTFSHQDPQMASKALNTLIDLLKGKHLQVFSDPKASFLTNQLRTYEKKLKNSETKLQTFKRQNNLSSSLKQHKQRLLDQRADWDTEFKKIKNEIQGLVSKNFILKSQMKTVPQTIPLTTTEGEGVLKQAREELFELKRQEQSLLGKYTKNSLPLQNLRKEIELLERFISQQPNDERSNTVTSGKNPIFQKLEIARLETSSALETKRSSMKAIADQIRELDNKILHLDQLNEEWAILERQKIADEQNVQLYLSKVEEAKVSEEMDRLHMSNISVIQPAEVPLQPTGRPASLKMLLGALFSTIVGLGIAFISEFFSGTYTRPAQARQDLGLPVLASFYQKSAS